MIRHLCTSILRSKPPSKLVRFGRVGICQYSDEADFEIGKEWFETDRRLDHTGGVKFGQYEEKEAREFLEDMDDIMKQRKKRLESELEEIRYTSEYVPEKMTAMNWKVVITECQSFRKRMKYFKFLWQKEMRNKNEKERKRQRAEAHQKSYDHRVIDELTFPSRYRIDHVIKYGGYRSLMFGNPIVFDLDYEMSFREQTNTMDQLFFAYNTNLRHRNSFHMHFTGYKNTRFGKNVEVDGLDKTMFASFSENSFSECFDLDQLIYLSPDGPVLTQYDPNMIYVIGGFVDLQEKPRESLGKTRSLNIKCGRLPLERYVKLRTDRDLTIVAMMNIMLHVNLTHNWEEAILKGMPRTKYTPMTEEEAAERRMKKRDKYQRYVKRQYDFIDQNTFDLSDEYSRR